MIYAHWTANTYTVSFNPNGGTCSTTSITVAYNSTYGTLPTPTRNGYTFLGWYTAANGGTQVTTSTKMGLANTTVYAQWKVTKVYLYNAGDQCTAITGGWNKPEFVNDGTEQVGNWATTPYLYWKHWELDGGHSAVYATTTKAINITPYSKLCMDVSLLWSSGVGDGGDPVHFCPALGDRSVEGPTVKPSTLNQEQRVTVTMDIGKYSGNYKISAESWCAPYGIIAIKIHQIWLE